MRTLEEKASLARRLRERAEAQGHGMTGNRFGDAATEASNAADLIRDLIDTLTDLPGGLESPQEG